MAEELRLQERLGQGRAVETVTKGRLDRGPLSWMAAGPTRVMLGVMIGGQPLGVYLYTLSAGQRIDLATFVIP